MSERYLTPSFRLVLLPHLFTTLSLEDMGNVMRFNYGEELPPLVCQDLLHQARLHTYHCFLYFVALVNKGNVLFAKRDYEKAREFYKEALSNDSSCVEALYNLGETLLSVRCSDLSVFFL